MKQLWLTAKLDIVESLRARWFLIYTLVFGGIVALLFLFGLTESRVLGFIGLSRRHVHPAHHGYFADFRADHYRALGRG
jgi:hypothetical protein